MTSDGSWTIYTDGASRANPGPAAFAYTIERPGQPIIEVSQRLGEATNNIAEYTALVKALEHARDLGGRRLTVHSDSELMVNQMNGHYKVKHAGLLPLYDEACRLRRGFDRVDIRHVFRSANSRADRLCNEALDGMESLRETSSPREISPPSDGDTSRKQGVPSAKNAPSVKKKTPGRKIKSADGVDERAVAYLHTVAAAWAAGKAAEPKPETVWRHLRKLLDE